MLEHQVDEDSFDRLQLLIEAGLQALAHQYLSLGIAGIGARLIAEDHARQLIQQQDQPQPALRRAGPGLQFAGQGLAHQAPEAIAAIGIATGVLAEPQAVALGSHLGGQQGIAEPPVQQRPLRGNVAHQACW
ncbi:MAG: hypothetical protein GAK43_01316 [Stenotrophomonas maltophilia]|nr:MAG: hypothetical protein GAK43_01316 [Stenotrophomonas maltophilia]